MATSGAWEPGDPVLPAPDPNICSFCHERRPHEMALHAGHTHVCDDCASEAEAIPDA